MSTFRAPNGPRPLRPCEKSLLAEVRRRPGWTVDEIGTLDWCGHTLRTLYAAAAHLAERGLLRVDDGRLYAARAGGR